ncbi:MAG: SGNH/GDSL hydrolase family protein [Candidatus Omnitrophica bacterium]|nr:SGNH/GDSL hydrolase family protein [Candidatus Omnitrophota bacterium]
MPIKRLLRSAKLQSAPAVLTAAIALNLGVVNLCAARSDTFRIIALGDSTTAGTPLYQSPSEFPPYGRGDVKNQFVYWLQSKHRDWEVLNAGVNAERIDQIALRLDKDIFSKKPDMVIVMAGVNDIYQGYREPEVFSGLAGLYGELASERLPFIACSILPYNSAGFYQTRKIQTVNQWIRKRASEWGGYFCDTYRAVEDPKHPGKLISTMDGLHPDTKAHQLLAETIEQCIESSLTKN